MTSSLRSEPPAPQEPSVGGPASQVGRLEDLIRLARALTEGQVQPHSRITRAGVAEEVRSALCELLGFIDLDLAVAPELALGLAERFPLLSAVTWEPPAGPVLAGEVVASFRFATLVGPAFRIMVMEDTELRSEPEARK